MNEKIERVAATILILMVPVLCWVLWNLGHGNAGEGAYCRSKKSAVAVPVERARLHP